MIVANSRLSRRIFSTKRLLSSVSGANHIPTNVSNSSEYESKIQSLKNNLHPQTLINLLSSTPDLNSSLRLFKWASLQNHFQHTADTYSHIIMKLGLASRVDEMEGFCNEMTKAGFQQSLLLPLIDRFIMHHKFDEAFRVFTLLSNSNCYEIGLINRLLRVLVEQKRGIESVLFVYKEMVKACVGPNTETLNCLMQALFDADRVDSVLDQYKRMQKKSCSPNSETYEIVVSGLIGKNFLDEGIVVLNEALESGCDLESGFFSRVLPLLLKMNRQEIGLRLFQKMKSKSKGSNLLIIVGRMVVQGWVPDSTTHQLLINIGSSEVVADGKGDTQDEITNILSEGFGQL